MSDLWRVVLVGFALCVLIGITLFVLWWGHDRRLDDLEERLAASPEPDTARLPAVHISDAPSAVAAARDANRPRPVPFPRQGGRHAAR